MSEKLKDMEKRQKLVKKLKEQIHSLRRKRENGQEKIFEEIMAQNNSQIEELNIVPRYTENKEKDNQRK